MYLAVLKVTLAVSLVLYALPQFLQINLFHTQVDPILSQLTGVVTGGQQAALPAQGGETAVSLSEFAGSMTGAMGAGGSYMAASQLFSLLSSVLLMPLLLAALAYVYAGRWQGETRSLRRTAETLKARVKQVVLTGLCVFLGAKALEMVSSLIYSALGLLATLTAWIPVVGVAALAVIALVRAAVGLAVGCLTHVAGLMAMMALLGDGLWGKPQAQQVFRVLWGGRARLAGGLAAIFALWLAGALSCLLVGALLLFMGVPLAGLMALFALAVSAFLPYSGALAAQLYLTERDRQEGAAAASPW